MAESKTAQEIVAIKDDVQKRLDRRCRELRLDFRLVVADEWVQEGDWVYLTVTPDRSEIRAYDYAQALSDVELELRRDEHVQGVLLIPSIAA